MEYTTPLTLDTFGRRKFFFGIFIIKYVSDSSCTDMPFVGKRGLSVLENSRDTSKKRDEREMGRGLSNS